MNKDRTSQRNEFGTILSQTIASEQYDNRTAQLETLQKNMVESFKILIKYMSGKVTKTEVINQLQNYVTTNDIEKIVSKLSKLDKSIVANKIDQNAVIGAINSLKRETILIPQRIKSPEKLESLKVSNLEDIKPTDLTKIQEKLDESYKQLKLIAEKRTVASGGGGNGTPFIDSEGKLTYISLNDSSLPIAKEKIMAGPMEDNGYTYLGYKKTDGTYFIKRKNLSTYLWGYTYFNSNFITQWSGKNSLSYGEPI